MSRNLKEMGDEPCAYLGGALKVKGSKPGQKWVYTWNVPEAPRWTMELGPVHSLQWSEREGSGCPSRSDSSSMTLKMWLCLAGVGGGNAGSGSEL